MPPRDSIHPIARRALEHSGWFISHDPYTIVHPSGVRSMADLAAERLIAAESGIHRVIVEIKDFRGRLDIAIFEKALGQMLVYRHWLRNTPEADRELYLAVTVRDARVAIDHPAIAPIIAEFRIPIMVFDPSREEVVEWRR